MASRVFILLAEYDRTERSREVAIDRLFEAIKDPLCAGLSQAGIDPPESRHLRHEAKGCVRLPEEEAEFRSVTATDFEASG